MADKFNWPMGYGASLEFEIFSHDQCWNDHPGLYIFAYQSAVSWYAVYVGQAENFRAQLPTHDRLDEAFRAGATHIHAKVVRQQNQRERWKQTLIEQLQPPLNTQQGICQQASPGFTTPGRRRQQGREVERPLEKPRLVMPSLTFLKN